MSVGVVMCLTSALWLLAFFPASAVARIGPSGALASTKTISYLERTPGVFSEAKHEMAELKPQSIERMDLRTAPQEIDSIFDFHSKIGDGGSIRRSLVGSSPPTCRSKCGTCTPCKPVHVAIGSPHGVISETEYYPEVWRCQCGNRYYMP
ncbi:hypothetical protein M758_12G155400 [Ceratodon purpureus]|uniref:Epidermal patterning factor-like protein n=1 Tax=Ceratodon purpureus TaxID=3225 RepID=A0A8T0G7I2_CERPU|nr:hypothetical protein KC19_12G153200 [Ceratodon purpureus]KAG0599487.1 hypothetical protein M758_12G155400 [Ceratodon purpureus]